MVFLTQTHDTHYLYGVLMCQEIVRFLQYIVHIFKYLFSIICVVIFLFTYCLFNDDVSILDYRRSSSCIQLQAEVLPRSRIQNGFFKTAEIQNSLPYCIRLQSSEFLHYVFWIYNLSIFSVYLKIRIYLPLQKSVHEHLKSLTSELNQQPINCSQMKAYQDDWMS